MRILLLLSINHVKLVAYHHIIDAYHLSSQKGNRKSEIA